MTNYLVAGSRLSAAEQRRRYALVRANELSRQLTAVLRPLEQSEDLAEPLQMIFDWIAEREQREPLPPPNAECINAHKW